jgi:periplasmic mercuric ion binding protein
MKITKLWISSLFTLLIIFSSLNVMSQTKGKYQQITIKTSAQCGMCKDRIEGAFAYEKGIKKSVLNLTDKVLTVTYDPQKKNPDQIRQIISKLGYDADDVAADPVAYKALPKCCQKPAGNDK